MHTKSRNPDPRRPTPQREASRLEMRRAALGFYILFAVLLGAALGANAPILALAAFVFLIAGVLIAGGA